MYHIHIPIFGVFFSIKSIVIIIAQNNHLSQDSVTVYVNAVMYFRVADAESAVNNVDDYAESAKLIASTTLRNVLGTKTLGKILSGETTNLNFLLKNIPF